MGKKEIIRYAYWSDRRIRSIADENGITLASRFSLKAKLPSLVSFQPDVEIGREPPLFGRAAIAERIERRLGDAAATDLGTPARITFAKGIGRVNYAHFAGLPGRDRRVVMHTTGYSSAGTAVEVCLFGSADNVAGFAGVDDKTETGWVSSAAVAVELYLRSRCTENDSQWDDDESIAMEALNIAENHGNNFEWHAEPDRPELRGWTFAHADDAEWFGEI